MKLRVLLINPWIYDFAAANFWSRPLGLLKVAECLSRFDLEISLIDCTDVSLKGGPGRGKYPKERVDKPASSLCRGHSGDTASLSMISG
jgi:hypothetical protein